MSNKLKAGLKKIIRQGLPVNDPNFMVIGSQKCGASSLHYYLNQHASLVGSDPKEVHFFDRDIHFGKRLNEYQKHFRGRRDRLHFESSPSYIYSPQTASKIYETYPEIKFIVTFRDPVKRAYSAWNHYRQLFEMDKNTFQNRRRREGNLLFNKFFKGRQQFPPFRECIDIELELIEKGEGFEPALLRRGLYLQQLQTYWQYFNPERMLILGFKDLVSDTEKTLNRVCEFIGVSQMDWSTIDREPRNVRDYTAPMLETDKQYLEAFFAEPNQALFERIGPLNW